MVEQLNLPDAHPEVPDQMEACPKIPEILEIPDPDH